MNDLRDIWLPLADRFYRAAYYLLESQEDAEDAVQELYLKIMKTPGRFEKSTGNFVFSTKSGF